MKVKFDIEVHGYLPLKEKHLWPKATMSSRPDTIVMRIGTFTVLFISV